MLIEKSVVYPNWIVPSHVKAFTTTRIGGVSEGSFASLNLGQHVGDKIEHVNTNRERLAQYLGDNVRLLWLQQTHSDIIIDASRYDVWAAPPEGDACVSSLANQACVVMTADCLPVLLCNQAGNKVAALHCGWRGLYQNLIAKTLQSAFANEPVIAWLGPAIGPKSYEVDANFYERFVACDDAYKSAFQVNRDDHYLCDLYAIASTQLNAQGVTAIYGGEFDTLTDASFYSHRQNAQTGRMASVIYFSAH